MKKELLYNLSNSKTCFLCANYSSQTKQFILLTTKNSKNITKLKKGADSGVLFFLQDLEMIKWSYHKHKQISTLFKNIRFNPSSEDCIIYKTTNAPLLR